MSDSKQNRSNGRWKWTPARRTAAIAFSRGRTWRVTAKLAGVSQATLSAWFDAPEFRAFIEDAKAKTLERAKNLAIAQAGRRVESQNDRWERLRRLIHERGRDPANSDVPGGKTGLLVRQHKLIGQGEDAQLITEYKFDRAPLAEMRALEEQTARELGQRKDDKPADGAPTLADLATELADADAGYEPDAPVDEEAAGPEPEPESEESPDEPLT